MALTSVVVDGIVVITVDGDLDHATAQAFDILVCRLLSAGHHHLVLDLRSCSHMDSAGLSVLLDLEKTLRGEGTLAVVGPVPQVRRLLDIVGLTGLRNLRLYDDMDAACTGMARPTPGRPTGRSCA